MTLSTFELNEKKRAPHVDGVLPVFHERWSPRSFAERDVSSETLAKVFEAARWAASAGNEQPWRFIVGRRGTETYRKIFESLMPGNQKWAGAAPVLMIGTALRNFNTKDTPNSSTQRRKRASATAQRISLIWGGNDRPPDHVNEWWRESMRPLRRVARRGPPNRSESVSS